MHRPIGPIGVQDIGNHIDVISSVFISGCKCFFSCKNSQKLGFGVRVNVSVRVMVSCRGVVSVTIDQQADSATLPMYQFATLEYIRINASNLQQADKLLRAQANSASYLGRNLDGNVRSEG